MGRVRLRGGGLDFRYNDRAVAAMLDGHMELPNFA
jgi:hypothetical protein